MARKEKPKNLPNLWLSHYLNRESQTTFFKPEASVRASGHKFLREDTYRIQGWKYCKKFAAKIEAWLDENGLSDNALKQKLIALLDAKEIKVVPDGSGGSTAIDADALHIQIKALDMAFKIKGSYAAEKREISGGLTIEVVKFGDGSDSK